MADSQSQLTHYLYRYRLAKFEMIAPGVNEPVDMNTASVSLIRLEKDFETAFYPLFAITIVINPKVKEFISINRSTVKFHLNLKCERYKISGSDSDPYTPDSSEDEFDTIFIPLITSNVPFPDSALYNNTVKELNRISAEKQTINDFGGNNMTADFRETVTYYLWIEKDLTNSKNIVNQVYSNTNIPTICADILSKNGFNSILMSPSDHKDPIKQCIIQPQNLLNVFAYLSDIYGMHKYGTMTFFDYRCVYILNKTGHPNCYERGEYKKTIFSVQKTIKPESWLSGTLNDTEKEEYHIFPDPHRVTMENPAAINDHIYGNNLTALYPKNNSTTHIEGTGNQRGSGMTRVQDNITMNEHALTMYANSVQEGNVDIKMTIFDVYMKALTPNKEFIIHWLDPNVDRTYSGYYRMRKVDFLFNRNGDQLTLTASMDLVKKEDISDAEKKAIEEKVEVKVDMNNSASGGVTKGNGLPGVG